MKKTVYAATIMFLITSCSGSWDEEGRRLFHQGCMESARENNMDESAAQSMCDCRLEKVMKKYPDFSEAMEHLQDIADDPEIRACK